MAKPIKSIIKKNLRLKVNGSLWLECGGKKYFGPGPVEILERIDKTGSINQAAREMRMSYKKAWKIISVLNTHAAKPLVETHTGGKKGGGSVISLEARELIACYSRIRKKFLAFLNKETNEIA